MAKRTRNVSFDSNFYCTKCGNKGIPIARKNRQINICQGSKKRGNTNCLQKSR